MNTARTILSLMFTLLAATTFAAEPNAEFKLKESAPGQLDVLHDGKPVARYMHTLDKTNDETLHATYKPYLHVFDKSGKAPITKGPGGQFTHHRGIFLGYHKVGVGGKTFDLWHMKGVQQVHQKFAAQAADDSGASFTSVIHWNNSDDQPILVEQRKFSFLSPIDGTYARIQLDSELSSTTGKVTLNGDPEHAGAQFRPADEVNRKATVYFFPGQKADPKKDRDYPWVGEQYELDGKTYSVVILNHPDNPKGTVFSAYRDYGRFGAFPAMIVSADKPAHLKYEWIIAEGEMLSPAQIQAEWNRFTGQEQPTPTVTVKPVSK